MTPAPAKGPEQEARQRIDQDLEEARWVVQDYETMALGAGLGVAIREFPLETGHGRADYLLFVDGQAVGVVEAKSEGHTLTGVETQTENYSTGMPQALTCPVRPLPFLYQSTGGVTRFTNLLDPEPRSREVYSFHRPETFDEWLEADPIGSWTNGWRVADRTGTAPAGTRPSTLRSRLRSMPPVHIPNLWANKVTAVTNLERSFYNDRPRALIRMATGSGKTLLAITAIYRLIKYGGARRILFLVDRKNLGQQAEKEFANYRTPDTGRKFDELYRAYA